MTLPAFLFGVLISTLMGALFHLWKGGTLFDLLIDVVVSLVGFWLGHFAGVSASQSSDRLMNLSLIQI